MPELLPYATNLRAETIAALRAMAAEQEVGHTVLVRRILEVATETGHADPERAKNAAAVRAAVVEMSTAKTAKRTRRRKTERGGLSAGFSPGDAPQKTLDQGRASRRRAARRPRTE